MTTIEIRQDDAQDPYEMPAGSIEIEHQLHEAMIISPVEAPVDFQASSVETSEPTPKPEHDVSETPPASASELTGSGNGLDSHAPLHVPQPASTALSPTPVPLSVPAVAEARGLLEGIAESLRTLAGRQGVDGASVAIFPRGVDLLEVRMHVARDQAIDLNFRVAGPQSNAAV
jgi:hypothetical protein